MVDGKNKREGNEAWSRAGDCVKPIGTSPSFFTRYIAALMRNKQENASGAVQGLSPASVDALKWLMLSKTLRSIIFFAGRTFKAEELPIETFDNPKSLALLFRPEELAALMGVSFLYKRLKSVSSEEEWKRSRRRMIKAMDIGGQLGQHTTGIGFARGLLAGAIPQLARAVLSMTSPDAFAQYKNQTRIKNVLRDHKLAEELLGTTEAHIGALLLNSMGFGRDESQAYFDGLVQVDKASRSRKKEQTAYRVCSEWVESLLITGQAPEVDNGDELEMTDESVDKLLPKIFQILEDDESIGWVEKNFSHIQAIQNTGAPKTETEIKEVDEIFLADSEQLNTSEAAEIDAELSDLIGAEV
jgi:hypothetical protein